jgi:hypothetical protein
MKPDPDFEDFARDYVRLARQEKSLQRRTRLLVLAREWMHAAMQDRPQVQPQRRRGKVRDR